MRRRKLKENGLDVRRAKAFTLVELLVVILIIAALMVIAVPRYFRAVYNSRVRGCQAQIAIIGTACEEFFAMNRVWPSTIEELCTPTAPSWVVSPPLDEVPPCPFGVPYEFVLILEDGTVGASPSADNPQVGVAVDTWDHFEGPWKTALDHRR